MRTYRLDFGREIDFPEDRIHESVDVFYPPNDTTTAYASVFTANRQADGECAPAEILEDFFIKSLAACNAEELLLSVDDLGCRAFFALIIK